MRVLIACEESQAVVKEFRRLGHEAYSCDIEECSGGHPEIHLRVDALELLKMRWDMIIAHPPCTFLTVTGNRWFNVDKYGDDARKRERERENAVAFFMAFVDADCPRIAVENPVGIMSTRFRKTRFLRRREWFSKAVDQCRNGMRRRGIYRKKSARS